MIMMCYQAPYVWRNAYGPIPVLGSAIMPSVVLAVVAKEYQVADLISTAGSRKREITEPRQVAIYFIKKYSRKISHERIGYLFGKDHSTITNSIQTVEDLMDVQPAFRDRINKIDQLLNIKHDTQTNHTAS